MNSREDWRRWAARQAAAVTLPPPPVSKYHARRALVEGVWFASLKEARRYQELRALERGGVIADLSVQPSFPLQVVALYRPPPWPVTIRTVGRFTADFQYLDCQSGEIVVEDVKSEATKTTAYRLRKRLAEAIHGITVQEV